MPFTIQTLLRLYGHIFSCFGRIAFRICESTYFKALFLAVSMDICLLLFIKFEKKMWKGLFLPCVAQSLFNDTVHCKLRAFSLFFLVRRAKRTKYLNDHAREWRPPLFLAASTLARACTPLTKSEEKERMLAVWRWCYTRWFATTIFSASQRCDIVATLFRMVTTLFQHCNAVLR